MLNDAVDYATFRPLACISRFLAPYLRNDSKMFTSVDSVDSYSFVEEKM